MENKNYSLTQYSTGQMKAFSIKYDKIVSGIITECGVSPLESTDRINGFKCITVKALWDTGAQCSLITKSTIKKLGLKAIDIIKSHHAGGMALSNVYKIHIHLPNQIIMPVHALDSADHPDFGLLIGMDIINKGNLTIMSAEKETMMSFELPIKER